MSGSAWYLVVDHRDPVRARRPPRTGSLAKWLAMRVLGWSADRLRGRLGVRVVTRAGRVTLMAESVDSLRLGLAGRLPDRSAARLTIRLAWWRGPWRGWSGRVGPLPGVRRERVWTMLARGGPAVVDIQVERPLPVAELAAAGVAALRSTSPLPGLSAVARPAGGPVLVDARQVNPRGRRADAFRPYAERYLLHFDRGPRLRPVLQPWRRGAGADLPWPTLAALRAVGAVTCPDSPGRNPLAEASLLVQLALTGVPVHAPVLAPAVADLVAPALRAALAEPLPARTDSLALELRSVRQRRLALRRHSTGFAGVPDPGLPTVSVLLATRRPEHLPTIVRAIAGQSYPNLEIVLCLHGIDLPPAVGEQLAGCGRAYQVVPVAAEVAFGTALGLATARAGGELVTKFDDDDTYGPEHVWDLVLARYYSGATLVGKGAEFIYLEDADVTIRRWSGRPEWDDSVVAGGTMLMARADLDRLGGWRPVPRAVDRGLVDRLNRAGATIYRTHPMGYLYHRRPAGHTWDPGQEFFLRHTSQRWDGLLRDAEFGTA